MRDRLVIKRVPRKTHGVNRGDEEPDGASRLRANLDGPVERQARNAGVERLFPGVYIIVGGWPASSQHTTEQACCANFAGQFAASVTDTINGAALLVSAKLMKF